jgi:hypothetical protein
LPPEGRKVGTRNAFDYFHVNSVQLDADGNLVISARNTWAAYKINRQTGAIIWTLGGKRSTLRMGPGTSFVYQHDVRVEAAGDRVVSVFDDGGGLPNVHTESRGLELALDFTHKRASLVTQDKHSPPLLADFEGNLQQLSGSDAFVGWGQQPWFTEFDSRGREILDGRFVDATSSYRAYRFPWSGQPAAPPAAVATTSRKTTTVYASWNGATNVAWWRVLGGTGPKRLHLIRTVGTTGFETAINVAPTRYVVAQALDGRRRLLGSSNVARVR